MKKLCLIVGLAILAGTMLGGCSAAGPVTLGNVFQNYPPRPRAVVANLEASLVVVDYQPKDADVWIEGWFTIPNDPDGASRRQISFTDNVIHGSDTMTGRASFVVASYDWPSGWGQSALQAGVNYYFMVTIRDPDGSRVSVTTWRFSNGAMSQIS